MTETALDDRYGRSPNARRRNRTIAIVAAAATAVVLVAWVVWAGLFGGGSSASLETRDIGHEILSDQLVRVEFQVTSDVGAEVRCVVEAMNESFAVVGWKTVDLPAATQRTRTFTEEVRTSELAVTGLIYRCWLQ